MSRGSGLGFILTPASVEGSLWHQTFRFPPFLACLSIYVPFFFFLLKNGPTSCPPSSTFASAVRHSRRRSINRGERADRGQTTTVRIILPQPERRNRQECTLFGIRMGINHPTHSEWNFFQIRSESSKWHVYMKRFHSDQAIVPTVVCPCKHRSCCWCYCCGRRASVLHKHVIGWCNCLQWKNL